MAPPRRVLRWTAMSLLIGQVGCAAAPCFLPSSPITRGLGCLAALHAGATLRQGQHRRGRSGRWRDSKGIRRARRRPRASPASPGWGKPRQCPPAGHRNDHARGITPLARLAVHRRTLSVARRCGPHRPLEPEYFWIRVLSSGWPRRRRSRRRRRCAAGAAARGAAGPRSSGPSREEGGI